MAVRGLLSRERENDTAAPKTCDCNNNVKIQTICNKRFGLVWQLFCSEFVA